MAIKRYTSDADNTITNAFKSSLTSRGTDANMGASDILETFSIYGQASTTSTELERILIKFPINQIAAARAAALIPASGSVNFRLKMYNAKTDRTVPRDLGLSVYAVSRSWQEGTGLDMDEYKDVVAQGDIGSTWMSASSTEAWTKMGGDYHASPVYNQTFPNGTEDLSLDVTPLVEEWLAGTKSNYGLGIHLTASQEAYFANYYPRKAVSFDGLACLSGTATMANAQPNSFSFWIKPAGASSTQYLLFWEEWGGGTDPVKSLSLTSGNNLQYYRLYDQGHGTPTTWIVTTVGTVSTSSWSHVVVAHNFRDEPEIYRNGVTVLTTITSPVHASTADKYEAFFLGGRTTVPIQNYVGLMDDVSYYNKVLTEAEVTEIYNAGCPNDLETLSTSNTLENWWVLGDSPSDVIKLGTPPTQVSIYDRVDSLNLYATGTGGMAIVGGVCADTTGFVPKDLGGELVNVSGSKTTYYTKKFFGKGTEFFFKKPVIEAAWDSSIKDDRGNFYASSSLLPASENNRTLYLHNVIGGRLFNIPAVGTGEIYLRTYDAASEGSQIGTTVIGGYVSQGVYSASFALDTTASTVYDRWYNSGLSECYYTGTIGIKTHDISGYNPYSTYVTTLTNLNPIYYPHETARFRFYVRNKDWSPNLYTVANSINDTLIIESASYQIHRVVDDLKIIAFDTGSTRSTETSFDVSGNYFDLDMNLFEPGYSYAIRMAFYTETVSSYVEQPSEWKFRVDKLETQ